MEDLKNNLIETIKENVSIYHFNASNTEMIIRCPYCGDSRKKDNHTHLFIKINNENNIFPYYCQRCNVTGIVNNDFLKDIGIYNSSLSASIETNIKEYKRKTRNKVFKETKEDNKIILPEFKNSKIENLKYNYISNRYSFKLSPEEYIKKYKVIFSFKNFLIDNEIEKINVNENMLVELSKYYVGFLSSDSSYIIFRNITPNCDKKKRYYMYNIFGNDIGNRTYTPTCSANLLKPNINLIISEGPFDIIGIKEYFYKDDNESIFIAVNGKGYSPVLNRIARLGFINLNISIYSDADVELNYYKQMKNYNTILNNNDTRIYYNTIEKDYGIKKENIQLKNFKLR